MLETLLGLITSFSRLWLLLVIFLLDKLRNQEPSTLQNSLTPRCCSMFRLCEACTCTTHSHMQESVGHDAIGELST